MLLVDDHVRVKATQQLGVVTAIRKDGREVEVTLPGGDDPEYSQWFALGDLEFVDDLTG